MAIIRAMTWDDLDVVSYLEAATAEAPHWTRSVYEGFLAEDSLAKQVFIAEDGGRCVGFVAGQIVADVCEMESIVVAATARRGGVGSTLLATLIDWARQHGASCMQLEVRAGNNSAIGLYEHAGLRKDGLRRGYYRNPEDDALLMSLTLEQK